MKTQHLSAVVVIVAVALSCNNRSVVETPVQEVAEAPLGRLPTWVQPLAYSLSFEIVPTRARFSGVAEITVRLENPTSLIWMHGRDLEVQDATIEFEGGQRRLGIWDPVDPSGVAALRFTDEVPPGEATIRIEFEAPYNEQLTGLHRIQVNDNWYVFTDFEPIDARRAFPCFDEPAFTTPFDVTLTVPQSDVALANSLEIGSTNVDGEMREVRFARTERIPTYLVAFAVGPFDVVEGPTIAANAVRREALPFRGIAARGQGPMLAYAMEHTAGLMSALEEYFGMPYPYDKLDIIAVPDFASGGMENVGAITFRSEFLLLSPDTITEEQRRIFTEVMAHELAHMWFGNLVTIRWWDDLWLKESTATWLSFKVMTQTNPELHPRMMLQEKVQFAMLLDERRSARQIRQPIESNHDIFSAYDSITYSKGAGVLEMFEKWMGPEVFRRGLRIFLERHRWGAATANDLLSALSAAADRNIATPIQTFVDQSGLPVVEITTDCSTDTPRLKLRQSRFQPIGSTVERNMTWNIPVCYRLDNESDSQCTMLTSAEEVVSLDGRSCPEMIFPNSDATGYYRWVLPSNEMTELAGQESLTPRERLSFVENLNALSRSNSLSIAEVLTILPELTGADEPAVANSLMAIIRFVNNRLIDEAQKPALERYARQLYASRFSELGWGPAEGETEDGETTLLRRAVITFLAQVGRDPEVRAELSRRAQAFLGYNGDGELHTDALPSDLRQIALIVAVRDGDESLFDAVLQRLYNTDDAILRVNLLQALGSTEDPRLSERVRSLTWDERLASNEATEALIEQFYNPVTREDTWRWYRHEFDRIMARVPAAWAYHAPTIGNFFCSEEKAGEVEEFFSPRVNTLPGAPRALMTSLERIRLCAARVQAQRESAQQFFSREP